jgi:hypothetical protein
MEKGTESTSTDGIPTFQCQTMQVVEKVERTELELPDWYQVCCHHPYVSGLGGEGR